MSDPFFPDAAQAETAESARSLALTFDPAEFASYVADFDLSEAQQRELLTTLWTIVVGFVDLGFHIHPVQQVVTSNPHQNLAPDSDLTLSSSINSTFNRQSSGACSKARAGTKEDS